MGKFFVNLVETRVTQSDHGQGLRRNGFDLLMYTVLVLLAALQFYFSRRAPDFVGDATYAELARSLLQHGWYGYNFRTETMLPPGFAALLAGVALLFRSSYIVFLRFMAVCVGGALLVCYELLRQEEGRAVASAAVALLGSSEMLFQFSTRLVFSDLPYFFVSAIVLLIVMRLDRTTSGRLRIGFIIALAPFLALSVMLRTAGLALVAGICASVAISACRSHHRAVQRLKAFGPALFLAIMVQAGWTNWAARHEFREWPLKGYPGSYVSQLELKQGNDPELGRASAADVLRRVGDNLADRTAALCEILFRKWTTPSLLSPLVLIVLLLGSVGFSVSLWRTGGGVLEWYFLVDEIIFLFWPWKLELRFLLPVVPFMILYVWRGAALLFPILLRNLRLTFLISFQLSFLLLIYAFSAGRSILDTTDRVLLAAYCVLSLVVLCTQLPFRGKRVSARPWWIDFAQAHRTALGALALTGLVLVGVGNQLKLGFANLHFTVTSHTFYPEIDAAKWIAAHTADNDVVMARKVDLVYHYSHHQVIWLPPISNARVLMDGISRYHVHWIVVVNREENYFLPAESTSFQVLSAKYPGSFHLAYCGPHSQIFAVSSPDIMRQSGL